MNEQLHEEAFENVLGYQVGVDEMKVLYRLQIEGFDITKDRAKAVLRTSSIVVALFGALQLINVQIAQEWLWLYNGVLISAASLYLIVISLCLLALESVDLDFPVADSWDNIYDHFASQENDLDVTKTLLAAYLGVINENKPRVVLLLFLTLIPRVPVR